MDKTQADSDKRLKAGEKIWWCSTWFWVAVSLGPALWIIQVWWSGVPGGFPQPDLALLLVVLVYPVLEECVFRGLLQGQLKRVDRLARGGWGLTPANLLASSIFALGHLLVRGPWSLLVFFPSLVFGYAFDRSGRLLPSILLHIFYNVGFVLFF